MSDGVVVPNNDPAAIESGNSWNGLDTAGAPVIVTFCFPTSLPAYDTTIGGFTTATIASFTPFTAAEQAQALQALGQWAAASGIVFIEAPPGEGDITFANVSFSTTTTGSPNGDYQSAGGIGFYPFGDWSYLTGASSSGYGFTSDLGPAGAVFMNSDYISNGEVNLGTLLHEIGHAIGMKHPDQVVYTADGVDHDQVLDPTENSATLTIMSETADGNGSGASLFALDKLAAADLYGPAGTGGVETGSATGSNSVSTWSWNPTTDTLTQTAVSADETIHGTSVNDIIYGYGYGGGAPTSGLISMFGLDGTNTLYAGSGDTNLYGGPGANTLVGGAGNDNFYVYSNQTSVVDNYTTGANTLYATGVNFTLPKNVDTLYLFGSGLIGTGNAQNDSMFGDGVYSNTLNAGSGDDYMVGGGGGNTLVAGVGVDTMYGGAGRNTFAFAPGTAPVNNPNGVDYIGDFKPGVDRLVFTAFASAGYHLTFVGAAPLTSPGQVDYVTSGGATFVEGDFSSAGGADVEIQLAGSLALDAGDFTFSGYVVSSGQVFSSALGASDVASVLSGGETSGVRNGGETIVFSGGRSLSDKVLADGTLALSAGAVATGGAVSSGGTLDVSAGGSALSIAVSSGGALGVSSGGLASATTVKAGGSVLDAGDVVGGGDSGSVTVLSGGVVSGGSVASGGSETVLAGGSAHAFTVSAGGSLTVSSGGLVSAATVKAGGSVFDAAKVVGGWDSGSLTVSSGGVTSAGAIASGGHETVLLGGAASGLTVSSGGAVSGSGAAYEGVLRVFSGGSASGGVLSSGATDDYYAGAAETLSLTSGATLDLVSASIGAGATFTAGAVASAETISGVALASGARLELSGATVAAGGTLDVHAGGVVNGLVLDGTAIYSGAATLLGALTGSGALEKKNGGALTISAGPAFAGKVVISAGSVTLAGAGGVGSGTIVFSGATSAAQLVIGLADTPAVGATFASEIEDFSSNEDSIDLAGLTFSAGATASVMSGTETLVLADGGKTYDFTLGGAIAPSFVVTEDGTGTLITADPPAASSAAQLVQTMAAFGARPDGPDAPTGSGATSSLRAMIAAPPAHAAAGSTVGGLHGQ